MLDLADDGTGALVVTHGKLVQRNRGLVLQLARSPANYYLGFVVNAAACFSAAYWGQRSRGQFGWQEVCALAAGFFVCTLYEYAFHRWFCHGRGGLSKAVHAMHHGEPLALIASPVLFSSVVCGTTGVIIAPAIGGGLALLFTAGMLASFAHYGIVHDLIHKTSIPLPSYYDRLRASHLVHHRVPRSNFGVTLRLWDIIFRTRDVRKRDAELTRYPSKANVHD